MRYLCLIYLDEKRLAAMPEAEMSVLNARHLEFNEQILKSGHFIEAEALTPGSAGTCVRIRNGRTDLTDGPYAETKEALGGFYLIEADSLGYLSLDGMQAATGLSADESCVACWSERYPTRITSAAETMHSRDESLTAQVPVEI